MSRSIQKEDLLGREMGQSEPVTDYDSKMVMLRAERGDVLAFTEVVTRIQQGGDIPTEATVVQRNTPYFGPKLLLHADEENFQLTAPGPDTQLLLWRPKLNDHGERIGWEKLAEVKSVFAEDCPQYDLCPECGQPVQTIEHERKAAVGRCPGAEL